MKKHKVKPKNKEIFFPTYLSMLISEIESNVSYQWDMVQKKLGGNKH